MATTMSSTLLVEGKARERRKIRGPYAYTQFFPSHLPENPTAYPTVYSTTYPSTYPTPYYTLLWIQKVQQSQSQSHESMSIAMSEKTKTVYGTETTADELLLGMEQCEVLDLGSEEFEWGFKDKDTFIGNEDEVGKGKMKGYSYDDTSVEDTVEPHGYGELVKLNGSLDFNLLSIVEQESEEVWDGRRDEKGGGKDNETGSWSIISYYQPQDGDVYSGERGEQEQKQEERDDDVNSSSLEVCVDEQDMQEIRWRSCSCCFPNDW